MASQMKPVYTWGQTKTYTLSSRTSGCLLTCIGMIILAIGVFLYWNTLTFLPGTVSTTGTITSCEMVSDSISHGSDCEPTISFQTQAGQHITFKSPVGSGSYVEGEEVTVLYHPNNPQDARLNPGIMWLVLVAFGLLFVLGGLFTYLRGVMRKSRE